MAVTFLLVPIYASSAQVAPVELPAVTKADLQPNSSVLENPSFDLLVLEIEEVRGGGRQPLEATVQILEVVRSRVKERETATATWDWDNFWGQKTFHPPKPGERFLAAAISKKMRGEKYKLSIVQTFAASRKNLQIAERYMARRHLSLWPVVVTPLIGWVLLHFAKQASLARPRTLFALGALVSALATLLLYYNYERHMSPYYTIRVDMLLVSPALLASLAIPFAVWRWVYRRKRGGADGG